VLFGVVILLGILCSILSVKDFKPSPKEDAIEKGSTDMPTVETIQQEPPKEDSITATTEDKPL
jgi:hypothetical protein